MGRSKHVEISLNMTSKKIHSYIESYGSFLPEKKLPSSEIVSKLKVDGIDLEGVTGIASRRVVENESSDDLALEACKKALERSDFLAKDIDLIISATICKAFDPSLYF